MRESQLSARLERLDAELTRIERKQSGGSSVIHDLQALTTAWRDLLATAVAAGVIDAPQARAARAWEA